MSLDILHFNLNLVIEPLAKIGSRNNRSWGGGGNQLCSKEKYSGLSFICGENCEMNRVGCVTSENS